MYLFHEKHLSARTVKGYRSAISSTISASGSRHELSDSPELCSLLRSFSLERPPERKILPQWDLSLVLQCLLKDPFEPIQSVTLKHLTFKTVFLTALATGKRRSELHAMCHDSNHFKQNQEQTAIKLYPDIAFIAKSQVLDTIAQPVKVNAFRLVGGEEPDKKLCPVRALLHYRKSTSSEAIRKGRRKLFISYKPSYRDEIAKSTISSWIVKTIRLAYETESTNPRALELHRIKAHEVRALSASWKAYSGASLTEIMEACTWRAKSTFSDYYLRDMCSYLDDLYKLGNSESNP